MTVGISSQFAAINREAVLVALFNSLVSNLGMEFTSMGRKQTLPPTL
jgi:hypothetical protein